MNTVKNALTKYGFTPKEAVKRGMPVQSVYKQFKGERVPSGEFAILYEQILGIPRWEIRPDLWSPDMFPAHDNNTGTTNKGELEIEG